VAEHVPGTPGPGARPAGVDDATRPSVPPSSAPPPGTATAAAGQPETLMQTLQSLWQDLPGLVSDRVELLSLELKRAGQALVQVVMLVVAVAILGVTAWLVLWAGVVAGLLATGLHLVWALLIVLAVNLVVMALAVTRVRSLLPRLKLPASRRHLTLSPSTRPTPPEASAHDSPDFSPAGQPAAR
jgi:hypothetical protein